MSVRIAPFLSLVLLAGCQYHVAERTDRIIADIARKPFDPEPKDLAKSATVMTAGAEPINSHEDKSTDSKAVKNVVKDVQTASYLEGQFPAAAAEKPGRPEVPSSIPGVEVPHIVRPKTKKDAEDLVKQLYPPLPALPADRVPLPGPDGKPYTLSMLQEIAALNSPALKQAASDVKAAEGNLIQARTYANPTLAYSWQPSNDGETAGVHGLLYDQKINTAGKMKLQIAAAQKDYDNAELALKRARSDLATSVRTAYFGLLVAKEAVRINRGLAQLTDEIYGIQVNLFQKAGSAASYEPAALRAQAYTARLALRQSLTNYDFAWKQVVTSIGLRQLPLSEVAGRIDSHIPYFDYDAVLAKVLTNHTDILTARNSIEKARYNLKRQQVTPISDVDVQFYVGKETSLPPFQWVAQGQVGITLPLWDRNKGNIINAEAGLIRAIEQPHLAELNLSNNLQNAYNTYRNSLTALEDYRRYILPDLVRAYRGVLERRDIDIINLQFGDLVAAQQTLATSVTSYLTVLGQIWTSAVQVADFLQTDDMFELSNPQAVPVLPDLGKVAPWPCCHPDKPKEAGVPEKLPNELPVENPGREMLPIAPKPLSSRVGETPWTRTDMGRAP